MATAPHKYITFGKFKKMNTKVDRPALNEDELAWLENLIPLGPNKLVTVPAPNSTPQAIINSLSIHSQYGATIGNDDYIIIFGQDGSGWAINITTNNVINFAAAGTFISPDMVSYASERILIIDSNQYSTWDGTVFVGKGGISPNIQVTGGATYSSTPTVTITGGSGTGATAHAVMGGSGSNQFVAEVVLDTPGSGYLPGDTIVVNFSFGGATATARIWPQVDGSTISVFAGRVWWASASQEPSPQQNVRILNFTGTAGYDDTNPANAAGATTITDADLAHNITALRGLNNYLYLCGDNSIRQIGSITVSSSITLFTPFTISSDIGTTFLLTVLSYNRFIVFANKNGVYGLYGSSVQKISDDLDGIFQNIDFSFLNVQAGLNDFHTSTGPTPGGGAIHCFMLLVGYNDAVLNITRPIFLIFDGRQWFIVSQGNVTNFCSLPNQNTLQWEPYGSIFLGGNSAIYHLLQDSNSPVAIRITTSLTPHGDIVTAKQVFHVGVAMTMPTSHPILSVSVDTENGSIVYPLSPPGGFQLLDTDADGYGHFLGFTITCPALVSASFNSFCIEYADADPWGRIDIGVPPPQKFILDQSLLGGPDVLD